MSPLLHLPFTQYTAAALIMLNKPHGLGHPCTPNCYLYKFCPSIHLPSLQLMTLLAISLTLTSPSPGSLPTSLMIPSASFECFFFSPHPLNVGVFQSSILVHLFILHCFFGWIHPFPWLHHYASDLHISIINPNVSCICWISKSKFLLESATLSAYLKLRKAPASRPDFFYLNPLPSTSSLLLPPTPYH